LVPAHDWNSRGYRCPLVILKAWPGNWGGARPPDAALAAKTEDLMPCRSRLRSSLREADGRYSRLTTRRKADCQTFDPGKRACRPDVLRCFCVDTTGHSKNFTVAGGKYPAARWLRPDAPAGPIVSKTSYTHVHNAAGESCVGRLCVGPCRLLPTPFRNFRAGEMRLPL